MAKLLSSWSQNVKSVPDDYILPPERRPQLDIPVCNEIPVLDLSQATGTEADRAKLAEEMMKALDEYMAFQVINHGVPEKVMENAMEVYKEFFSLPTEDKEKFMSSDGITDKKTSWLYTSAINYDTEKIHSWKDALGHVCYPVEETINSWPDKPARYREVVAEYAVGTKKLSQMIMELIAEGLGLEKEHFAEKLTEGHTLVVNHYPKCPDPSLTIGLTGHHDPNMLTMIQQNVCGLQIFKDGKWVGVEPLPNAFLVHNGYQLEIISNGRFRGALHRVVTNADADRTSIGVFTNPNYQSIIEPAKAVLSDANPPKFRAFTYGEFMQKFAYGKGKSGDESVLNAFQLRD